MIDRCRFCEPLTWTEEDIGETVELDVDGVRVPDTIIQMWLPNGHQIIGPSLTCGQIFARFTMLPSMIQASEQTRKHLEGQE